MVRLPDVQEPSASQQGSQGQALAGSLRGKLQQLESSLAALSGTLQEQVQASQQQTLEHLLLYESAVDELQVGWGGVMAGGGRLDSALHLECARSAASLRQELEAA